MNDTVEERSRKRRWLSLAELVGVGGLLIAGAGLYFSWSDRRDAHGTQVAQGSAKPRVEAKLRLKAIVDDDGVTLRDAADRIESVDVRFPAALEVEARTEQSEPRIKADWFRDALLKATDGGADEQTGRLPVLVTVRWWDEDVRRQDRIIYSLLWRTSGRVLQGRSLKLTGAVIGERDVSPDAAAARLDALWRPSR